ncbi:MAG: hypothetical protein IT462_06935 [Planctomycetes bacterium]|nr:hypothetical protein [Planctomycetota bacterium]
MTRMMLKDQVKDANGARLHLGDRVLDVEHGSVCVLVEHCPDLGPDCLYVQSNDDDGPVMGYWVAPDKLQRLNRAA